MKLVKKVIASLSWPGLPSRYDRALHLAVSYIRKRFKPTAIIVSGTIVRGKPHASSDLDLYVIHRKPFMQRVQKIFNGVPAEIFVNTPATAVKHLQSQREMRRPITAHMISTGIILLDNEPLLPELTAKAKQILKKGPLKPDKLDIVHERYFAGSLYEDAVDISESDPATAQMILSLAVYNMLKAVVLISNRYEPRNKDLLAVVKNIDPVLHKLAVEFYLSRVMKERTNIAGRIADRSIKCRGFIEWESKPVKVKVLDENKLLDCYDSKARGHSHNDGEEKDCRIKQYYWHKPR